MSDYEESLSSRLEIVEKRLNELEGNVDGPEGDGETPEEYFYCEQPDGDEPALDPGLDEGRVSLIRVNRSKWVNGTTLKYYFFDRESDGQSVFLSNGGSEWRPWTTTEAEMNVVRQAFDIWKQVGIGLEFKEVNSRHDADIRIGFQRGDGAWSYLGRGIQGKSPNARTMNFGWDLTRGPQEIDTAVHEIGHTLGFPHEHQNPHAGIIWNEEAVYRSLSRPPNRWSREKTFHNIIRKIQPDTVQGSNWDPDSIMHYPFGRGMIKEPVRFQNGLSPNPGLSDRDKTQVKFFYPPLEPQHPELKPFKPEFLSINPGEQKNFVIKPESTRNFNIGTFGESDSVMVLFENEGGDLEYRAGDDDSGMDYNAKIKFRLVKGREYVVRVRLYYSSSAGETALMLW
ncbi:MAG: matrixin family metalloprotease [Candidatus Nitronauta litoralis]|uniref:Matrixin family metalloprotease n=1 Tax=Candidatus Nitronauta litoralis TaxID=2705533 RepID=A0A7T0FZ37_9BACT|nr:MAG: matrixin family metalloprotease [Candidatus Nitronauta litoralis]